MPRCLSHGSDYPATQDCFWCVVARRDRLVGKLKLKIAQLESDVRGLQASLEHARRAVEVLEEQQECDGSWRT